MQLNVYFFKCSIYNKNLKNKLFTIVTIDKPTLFDSTTVTRYSQSKFCIGYDYTDL